MIHFKSCEWKNFLSTGADPIKILLDRSPTTLIVGQNGAGKSTLLDALSFALFGKPHRDIKKDQMINSINKKGTLVTVEFTIGTADFKIVRGIKPAKFEIYQNGNLINQASNARDYQKFLEQNILKLNHKSFHQVVVLGSSSFIPFMQLPVWSRRGIIEDLLDINIFSKMNMLLKERNSKIKDELTDINHHIDIFKTKIDSQSKYIKDLQELNDDQIVQKQASIDTHKEEINRLFEESKELGKNLAATITSEEKHSTELIKKVSQLDSYDAQFNDKIKSMVSESRFYEENNHCPTCDQDIEESKKEEKIDSIKAKAKEIQEAKEDLQKNINEIKATQQEVSNNLNKLRQKQNRINSNNDAITLLQKEIDKIQKEINNLQGQSGDVSKAKRELNSLRKK